MKHTGGVVPISDVYHMGYRQGIRHNAVVVYPSPLGGRGGLDMSLHGAL